MYEEQLSRIREYLDEPIVAVRGLAWDDAMTLLKLVDQENARITALQSAFAQERSDHVAYVRMVEEQDKKNAERITALEAVLRDALDIASETLEYVVSDVVDERYADRMKQARMALKEQEDR